MVLKIPVINYNVEEPYPAPRSEWIGAYEALKFPGPDEKLWHTHLPDTVRATIGAPPPGCEWEIEDWESSSSSDSAETDSIEERPKLHYRVRPKPLPGEEEEKKEALQETPEYRVIARAGQQVRLQPWQISDLEKCPSQTSLPDLVELDGMDFDLEHREIFNKKPLPFGRYLLSTFSPHPLEQKICNHYKVRHRMPDIESTMGGRTLGTIRSIKKRSCYVFSIGDRETPLVKSKSERIWRFFPMSIERALEPWQWEGISNEWRLKDSLRESGRQLAKFETNSLNFERECGLSDASREEVLLSVIAIKDSEAQQRREAEREVDLKTVRPSSSSSRAWQNQLETSYNVGSAHIGGG